MEKKRYDEMMSGAGLICPGSRFHLMPSVGVVKKSANSINWQIGNVAVIYEIPVTQMSEYNESWG
jgi:hypothetical protein